MTRARFSIGIDLGTTNCALAFVPLEGDARSEILPIPQWDLPTVMADASTLPSFLYLPEEAVVTQLQGKKSGEGVWVIGRLARTRAAETPGRVAHSAKSWLCHHAVDRSAPFLPWGSTEIANERKISPVRASALILGHLRDAWNDRFADAGADFAFDSQIITVTVPASFDAAAQRLTVAAAQEAGFPETVRLLEEPQAAFYHWLEQHDPDKSVWDGSSKHHAEPHHVLVVDIGGGTSDFSLFEFPPHAVSGGPRIKRIAVSNHILLGGDNIDLAVAHRVESQLVNPGEELSGGQWSYLVARCRDVKERALSSTGPADEAFAVVMPGRGSSLIAGARSAHLSRADIEALVLDGFFPECDAKETPLKMRAALGEWGLPYAADPAITRHLADFLKGRPAVDAVLFNGGSLNPKPLRQRIGREIGKWQARSPPVVFENPEPDLAVARGAARFGKIVHTGGQPIDAGAAHAIFLEAHRARVSEADGEAQPALVCILPRDASSEVTFEIADLGLELRINRPVRFRTYYSTRNATRKAGDVIDWNDQDFRALPPLETVAQGAVSGGVPTDDTVPVSLSVRLNELGLLQVSCVSADSGIRHTWPLEFNLRPHDKSDPNEPGSKMPIDAEPQVAADALNASRRRIESLFKQPLSKRDKLTAGRLIKSLETILGAPKAKWNLVLVRSLWSSLEKCMACRRNSVEHEEAWLILAGFLLRPGFGASMDDVRIGSLWTLRETGLSFPAKMVKLQEHILWRRVAGGLSRERQESILAPEIGKLRQQASPSPELVLLAGALERIGREAKTELVNLFIDAASVHAEEKKHYAHFLAALGLLLNRTPLYAGPETVVSPDLVEQAFEAFSKFDWTGPKAVELQALFLRAARVVNHRALDVPQSVRNRIAQKLEKADVPSSKTLPLKQYMTMDRAERVSLFGESLPPGLIMREASTG